MKKLLWILISFIVAYFIVIFITDTRLSLYENEKDIKTKEAIDNLELADLEIKLRIKEAEATAKIIKIISDGLKGNEIYLEYMQHKDSLPTTVKK